MKGLIIGAGIAGLSAAIALRKAGLDYEIFEAAPELKPVGAGISLSINAMRVYRSYGLADKITALGFIADEMVVCDEKHRVISSTNAKKYRDQYGFGYVLIHRSRLQDVLLSAIDPTKLATGKRLKGVEEKNDKVIATFEDGSQAKGDFLIGADGIHSVTRKLLFPQAKLRYAGQTCWRGITKLDAADDAKIGQFESWGGKLRFGCTPIGLGEVYFFAVRTAEAGGIDDGISMNESLANEFSAFESPVPELLRRSDPSQIIRSDLWDLEPMKSWHRGRILLIGDAAHATTPNLGQGGCQAAEDAFYLGRLLEKGSKIPLLFDEFERIRRPKVDWIVNTSWKFGRMAHWTKGKRIRNWFLRMTPLSVMERQFHKIFHIDE